MRSSSDKFGDGVSQSRVGVDIEYGENVPAVFDTSLVQDHRDKVHA